ncbi:MAG: lamin tail domain-containing protein [bacterium]|nr:MAG: lamin tail domain-containing protein [bacterium]
MKLVSMLLFVCFITYQSYAQDHLLVTEFVVTPTEGEFIEIYNPTSNVIVLSDYYVTDATFASGGAYYYNIVTGSNAGGGGFDDFHARFPEGASIGPYEAQTIAMNGTAFNTSYGMQPTYELYNTDSAIPDLREALPGSINNQGGLTNSGEVVIIYYWDGQTNLVSDIDYVVWGDKVEAVDKTGITIGGSTYLNDTPIAQQISISSSDPHGIGESVQRLTAEESGEITTNGNGITGNNETSENLATSFQSGSPSPGQGPAPAGIPVISNIQQNPSVPTPTDQVTISAQITDEGTITRAFLYFSLNSSSYDSLSMTALGSDLYEGIIAAQPAGTVVSYFLTAKNNQNLSSVSDTSSYTVVSTTPGDPHVFITEMVVQPSDGEFIEIFNPTGSVVDLSNYYLTDATFAGGSTFYYNIVLGSNAGGGDFGDFHARFPQGAVIQPNEAQTVAINGSGFVTTYAVNPTYELFNSDGNIPDMREALPGSINNQGSLTNDGEVVILYAWDGQSDLVQDLDYLLWGDKAEAVDKSGVSIGGSTYLEDTPISQQIVISSGVPHDFNQSVQRLTQAENGERLFGGNGITGHDETSENLAVSFQVGVPSPNIGPVEGAPIISDIQYSPAEPTETDPVTISATITDNGQIINARLFYSVNSAGLDSLEMLPTSGNLYEAVIDPQENSAVVQFYVKAVDDEGNSAKSSGEYFVVGIINGAIPIKAVKDNLPLFEGQVVTIEGVVTLGAGIINRSRVDAYIQDNSARGINIFSFDPPSPAAGIVRGNRLRMTGTITVFGDVTEITDYSIQIISQNNPIPDPLFVSTAIANDIAYEGTYMKVSGIIDDIEKDQGDNDANITLRDDKGTVLIRVWQDTGINIDFLGTGDTLTVQGVMDVFSSQAQIIPGYRDEIIVPGKTARADGSGIALTIPSTVNLNDSLQNFTIAIIGNIDAPIQNIRLDLPKFWGWSGLTSDLSIGGSGVQDVSVSFDIEPIDSVYQIYLSNADISNGDTALVSFSNLTTPAEPLISLFWIWTAGENGRLTFINTMPRVVVGGGDRHLIYDLQLNSGQFGGDVKVQGVTTIGAGLLRKVSSSGDSLTTAYIQDKSGRGINLFRFGLIDPLLVRKNLVEVTGIVTEFNGVTEIEYTTIRLLSFDEDLPEALELSNAEVNSRRWDGTLVRTAGVILERFSAGGGTTLEIGDGKGNTSVRVWDTAELDLTNFVENSRIFVEGVGGLFISNGDSIYQLLTTYQDQLAIDPNYSPTLDIISLNVPPYPFVPDRGEKLEISYNAGAVNNRITLRIFDLGGRSIVTLLDESAQLVEGTIAWDGRDKLLDFVPLGTYLCLLEVMEPVTGKKRTKVAPVVVGTILQK